MSLVSNLQTLTTRIATEFKAHKVLINGNATDLSALTTTSKTNLVSAINEVKAAADSAASSGGATNLDGLSDVVITTAGTGQILRHDGTNWVNVTGTTYFDAAGAAASAQSASQPLDSDLTAIAALTTTTFGRSLLTLADSAALTVQVATGTSTTAGKLQLATTTEATTGTDTAKAVTAAGTKAAIDARIDNTSTLGSSTTNAPSQAAVKAYADALIAANDAMVFKGVLDASASPNYPAANRGDTYKISVAGKVGGASGVNVEVGDLIICITDGTAAGTQATVGANWTIVQSNIDGAVVGPASAVSGDFATFSGTSGKLVQDSGISLDTDGTLTANSNTKIPSQAAVKTYAQPKDATLTALAGLTTAADQMVYATGVDTFAMTSVTAFARTFLDDADAATVRSTLSVYSTTEIGDPTTDFVATFNAGLV